MPSRRQSRSQERPPSDRKALQLCEQIAHVLDSVLGGEAADDVLRDLTVVSVTPAPHSGRLLVLVQPREPVDAGGKDLLTKKLRHAAGWLRSEVAASINRRKTPELVFQLLAHVTGPEHRSRADGLTPENK